MGTIKFETTVELDVDVDASVHLGYPGYLSGPPENCYPEEPTEVESLKVCLSIRGEQIDITKFLSGAAIDQLKSQCIDALKHEFENDDWDADV